MSKKAELWFAMSGACHVDVYVDIFRAQTLSVSPLMALLGISSPPVDPVLEAGIVAANPWHQPLTSLLRLHANRIRALALRSPSEALQIEFFAALYFHDEPLVPPVEHETSPSEAGTQAEASTPALESLKLHVTCDKYPPNPAPLPFPLLPTEAGSHLPPFPHLTSMTLTNVAIPSPWPLLALAPSPFDPSGDVLTSSLKYLSILRPLRAPPLSSRDILAIVRASPDLVKLDVRCRILEVAQLIYTPIPILHHPASPIPTPPTSPNSPSPATPMLFMSPVTETKAEENDTPTIPLSSLTHLTIHTNHVFSLLSPLHLPSLHTLHIVDFDGRQAGPGFNNTGTRTGTADAVKNVLMRTPMPRIKDVSLIGVGFGFEGIGECTWEWCFKRLMWVENMKLERCISLDEEELDGAVGVMDLLAGSGHRGKYTAERICPRMTHLSLALSTVTAHQPAEFQKEMDAIDRLRERRRDVKMDVGMRGCPHLFHAHETGLGLGHADVVHLKNAEEKEKENLSLALLGRPEPKDVATTSTIVPRRGFGFGSGSRRKGAAVSRPKAEKKIVVSVIGGDEDPALW